MGHFISNLDNFWFSLVVLIISYIIARLQYKDMEKRAEKEVFIKYYEEKNPKKNFWT